MRCEVWDLGRDPIVVVQQYLVLVDAILRREVADAGELLDHRLLAQRQRLQREGERGVGTLVRVINFLRSFRKFTFGSPHRNPRLTIPPRPVAPGCCGALATISGNAATLRREKAKAQIAWGLPSPLRPAARTHPRFPTTTGRATR